RLPRHGELLQWRRSLCAASGTVLADAAAHVQRLARAEEFDAATAWLCDAALLARDAMAQPGGCPIAANDGAPAAATLLHRDPIEHLRQLGAQLEAAREELAQQEAAVLAAEARFDLAGAVRAVDAMA